jgi:hypothetical protein
MSTKSTPTSYDRAQLEAFVKEYPDVVGKLHQSVETYAHELQGNRRPEEVLVEPSETDIAALASLASRASVSPGARMRMTDDDWAELVFIGACVFVA